MELGFAEMALMETVNLVVAVAVIGVLLAIIYQRVEIIKKTTGGSK